MLFLRKYGVIFHAFFLFSKSQGKKKNPVKSFFTEEGRRSYVITKKKNQPPLIPINILVIS